MTLWAQERLSKASQESYARLVAIQKDPRRLDDPEELRRVLLDFIADFANWDNSTDKDYLNTARALTQAAHEALGGEPGTRPLVVDPFAGGGSIPLEALRVGADAFASDLNPVAVLLNKVVLEYIPKYGQRLADEVCKWGRWIKELAEKELAEFYPKDSDGATPIAYLWARTILSEAPGQGDIPIEVPLMRSLWLTKKTNHKVALRWVRAKDGQVQTDPVEVTYSNGVTRTVRRPMLEIFEPKKESEVSSGTVARGSVTCPVTGFTTPVASVRAQLKTRGGGTSDARLFCVVTTKTAEQGRFYRLPTKADMAAERCASAELEKRRKGWAGPLSLVPEEVISFNELRRISVPIYGMKTWGDLFTPRQLMALTTLGRLVREMREALNKEQESTLVEAVQTCLAMAIDRQANSLVSLARWNTAGEKIEGVFSRQAIGMVWDFVEGNPLSGSTGDLAGALAWVQTVCAANVASSCVQGQVACASASEHLLPNDSALAFMTDPPYYDAVPYAYLSDFFYVWMRRTLATAHPDLMRSAEVPKDEEIVVDRPHQLSRSTKDITFYERELGRAFTEGRRILRPDGIGTVVFASKTTSSWEAILQAIAESGWTITGSWPIDTEMGARVAAQGQARLASSIHLVCRPRENPDGSLREDNIGEWRDVLAKLPQRIHEWMPRLAAEGVIGADAIFACLGPALEIFSRYSRVEKASGEAVTLKEYLECVWAAVAKEALTIIFPNANTTGFEEDARLTAMWLWTLNAGNTDAANGESADAEEADDESDGGTKKAKTTGFVLEYDAARKIAQGLGAHLEDLGSLVEVSGDQARLLPVGERARHLFGKDEGHVAPHKKKKVPQLDLFKVLEQADGAETTSGEAIVERQGKTVLDRIHQSMILFAAGRSETLKRFLVEEGVGRDPRFWSLAQALSALYPTHTTEKRWIDGVLARKKGLGF